MSEFGRLRKHEKTQHALVGQGSAALAAAAALPGKGGQHSHQGLSKLKKTTPKQEKLILHPREWEKKNKIKVKIKVT